jgi:GDP-L-fucose synthase
MIYFGSGAEYDKSKNIRNVTEENDYGKSLPFNVYGFSKYIMNLYAVKSDNIYNFRLFGTINPYEPYTKNVLSNICMKAIKGIDIELNQNCLFSWVDIDDVISFIRYAFTHELKHHDYNLVNSQQCSIKEMAEMINDINQTSLPITFKKDGLNLEYTASNERWLSEYDSDLTTIKDSLKKVHTRMHQLSSSVDITDIDSRWSNTNVNKSKLGGGGKSRLLSLAA